MKRVLIAVAVCTCLLCTGCSVVIDKYNEITGKEVITEQEAAANLNPVESFNKNFEAKEGATEFVFNGAPITGNQKYENMPDGTRKVVLFVTDNLYYPIYIPDYLDIVTDNCSYIYATDESLSVSVVSGVDVDNFSSAVGFSDAESITPNLIVSTESIKGPCQAALHVVNDKAIIVRTYDNDVAFNKIVDGLQSSRAIKPIDLEPVLTENTRVLSEFPSKYTGFTSTVNAGLGDSLQKMYSYEDGCLNIAKQMRKFDDAKKFLNSIAVTASGTTEPSVVYDTDDLYYVEIGDITYAVMSLNYNTCLTCYGVGEEARFNVVEFVNYQM